MHLYLLCPQWGHEHRPVGEFLDRVKAAGYDGVDMWLPDEATQRHRLYAELERRDLRLVAHQHQASGPTAGDFRASFRRWLGLCAEGSPLLINSHTGRDYFSFAENLGLVDEAAGFSAQTGLTVAHETHRGRLGYAPQALEPYLDARPHLPLTADLSHWVCVTESYLEGFPGVLAEALRRAVHVHARVGHPQGPQVPDPRAPEWAEALGLFVGWWRRIAAHRRAAGSPFLTITTEFGPPPYLPTLPFTGEPVADQWAINVWLKNYLRAALAPEDVPVS